MGDIVINNCYNTPDGQVCNNYLIPGEAEGVTNYYPFGMIHNAQYYNANNNTYNYKYNGKELQETGMYDYGARFYMPDIGRWGVVDLLAEKYNSLSPYNYTLNNPIRYVDPDGRDGGVSGKGTKDDPFVIMANYYHHGLTKEQKSGLSASIAEYNNGGNAREIDTKDGKIYVKYQLSEQESESMDAAISSAKNDRVENSDGSMVRLGNYISNESIDGTASADANQLSIRSDAAKVMGIKGLNYVDKFKNDFNHEIGHNLGGVHGDPGGMMNATDNLQRNADGTVKMSGSPVTNDSIRAIIGRTDMTKNINGSNVGYGIVDSKYITPTELDAINAIKDQKGSNGRLKSIK